MILSYSMKVVAQLCLKDWLIWPEVQHIYDVLNVGCEAPHALFVGGCVRNLWLDQSSDDIDIAALHTPDIVTKRCQEAGFQVIPTGIDHGTVTVVVGDMSFEVTTLRRDVATDGRRATIRFSTDWREDAARRDFTMNTLLADAQGHIYDPLACGLEDLKHGRVVFVGDPKARIAEDILRILRFFRFHAYYGHGNPDQAALSACQAAAGKIPELSRERITQEFLKILAPDNAVSICTLMRKHDILKDIIPSNLTPLQNLMQRQSEYDLVSVTARLYMLSGDHIACLQKYIILKNTQLGFFSSIKKIAQDAAQMQGAREIIYRHGQDLAAQYFMMFYEDHEAFERAMGYILHWDVPSFPLSGRDLIAAGIVPGPAMGDALRKIEKWWILQDYKPDKKLCLAELHRI